MRRNSRRAWLFRLAAAAVLICAFGYTPYHLYRRSGFAKYLQLRRELDVVQGENDRLREDIAQLSSEAAALRDDPRAIERVARHEFGWVRPGDIVLDFGGR